MPSRCRIFDRIGLPMAEIDATFERAWVLNDYGEMEFTISQGDAKATAENLRFGNYILVEHDKLPPWGGFIDPPRRWSGDGQITVSAYTAEKIFSWRVGDDLKLKGNAGAIFKQMIALTNKPEDTSLREGQIYTGGTAREETLQSASLLDDLKSLAKRANNDFGVDAHLTASHAIYFEGNWYYQRGVYRPDIPLMEGHNIELPDGDFLVEQNDIVNEVLGYGDGPKGGSRIKERYRDAASASAYRLRQGTEYFPGNEIVGTLRDNTQQSVDEKKEPEKVFRLYALNVGNAFSLRLGDILPLELYSVGFSQKGSFGLSTLVRVVGMRFNDDEGKLELVTKEVTL